MMINTGLSALDRVHAYQNAAFIAALNAAQEKHQASVKPSTVEEVQENLDRVKVEIPPEEYKEIELETSFFFDDLRDSLLRITLMLRTLRKETGTRSIDLQPLKDLRAQISRLISRVERTGLQDGDLHAGNDLIQAVVALEVERMK